MPEIKDNVAAQPVRRRLPDERQAIVHCFNVGGYEGYLTVGFYEDGSPGEIFITTAREGKQAVKMTRLSCHRFRSNEVRLWLSVIAYNLGNLGRRLVLPNRIGNWSLTSLQQRLVNTGGRLLKHARCYWLLLAESHLTRRLFGAMVRRIGLLSVPAG